MVERTHVVLSTRAAAGVRSRPEMVDRWDPTSGNFPGYFGIPVSMDVEPMRTDRLAMTLDQFRALPEGFKAELSAIARPGHTLDERVMHPDRAMGPDDCESASSCPMADADT